MLQLLFYIGNEYSTHVNNAVGGSVRGNHHGAGYVIETGAAGGVEEGRPRAAVKGLGRLCQGVPGVLGGYGGGGCARQPRDS